MNAGEMLRHGIRFGGKTDGDVVGTDDEGRL